MNNSKQQTATAAYRKNLATAQETLRRIAAQLAEHEARQAAQPLNWGYVGDLGHINEELAQVLAGLGDRSATEALGLKY
jgi:hypothetical protein